MAEKNDREKFLKLFYDVEILGKGSETEKKELEDYVSQMTPKKHHDMHHVASMTPEQFKREFGIESPLFSAVVAKRCIEEYPEEFKDITTYRQFKEMCDYIMDVKSTKLIDPILKILEKNNSGPKGYRFAA